MRSSGWRSSAGTCGGLTVSTQEHVPYDVIRYGEWLLDHNMLHKMGQEVWAFLEQLGLAAAELGKQDLAEVRGMPHRSFAYRA